MVMRKDDLVLWRNATGADLTIGQKVKVDQSNAGASDWVSDWDGVVLIVTGIVVDPKTGKADIHAADENALDVVHDGFTVQDLLPVL